MKKLYFVANWKSNKTAIEAKNWFQKFKSQAQDNKEIIICPSFILLPKAKYMVSELNLPIKLGAQNISPFGEGAYTGEVNGRQIKEFADYVLIGHSERRVNFREDEELLNSKVDMAVKFGLSPIFCVGDQNSYIPDKVKVVAYEPPSSISTNENSKPDTPENAESVAKLIKEKNPHVEAVLYGGSVSSVNVNSYTQQKNIEGVLVGGKSLDVEEFSKLIQNG